MKNSLSNKQAWLVVMASFFTLFSNPAINYAVGVLHMGLVETYPEDKHILVWQSSLFSCMFALAGPISSLVINIFDCRTCVIMSGILGMLGFLSSHFVHSVTWLFLTYSVMVGLSESLSNTAAVVVLGFYFKENTALATGIASTGSALGMFVYPSLTNELINMFGLHGAFLILAGIPFQCCVFGLLMRPSKFERVRKRNRQSFLLALCGGEISQFGSILTDISFLFFLTSMLTFSMGLSSIYLYLPDYFVLSGATRQVASFSVSVSGIGSVISRFLSGFAASEPRIGSFLLFSGLAAMNGFLVLFISFFSPTTTGQLIYGFLLGLYSGGIWVLCGPVAISILGVDKMSNGYGLVMLSTGIGYLLGPPIAGFALKSSDQYITVFVFSAIMCLLSSVCCFLSYRGHRHSEPQREKITVIDVVADSSTTDVDSFQNNKTYLNEHDIIQGTVEEGKTLISETCDITGDKNSTS